MARDAFDREEELKVLKQIATIQGLTKVEPEGDNDIFRRIVKTATQERERALEAEKPKMIEAE